MALHHSPKIETNNLVFYCDFANSKSYPGSGSTAYSLTKDKLSGAINSPATVTDGYLDLPNTGASHVDWGDNVKISGSFSMNIWFYGSSNQGATFACLFGKGGSNFGNYGFFADTTDTYVRFGFHNGSNQPEVDADAYGDVKAETWVNYQGTYDITTGLKLYRNSVLVDSLADTTTPDSTVTWPLAIGARLDTGGDDRFRGRVGLCSIYDTWLTQEQVLKNFNAHKGRYGL